jgi:hypothetical protein
LHSLAYRLQPGILLYEFETFRRLNAPVPGDGGSVPFNDLRAHFVIGGDEAYLMASATGVVKVLCD